MMKTVQNYQTNERRKMNFKKKTNSNMFNICKKQFKKIIDRYK